MNFLLRKIPIQQNIFWFNAPNKTVNSANTTPEVIRLDASISHNLLNGKQSYIVENNDPIQRLNEKSTSSVNDQNKLCKREKKLIQGIEKKIESESSCQQICKWKSLNGYNCWSCWSCSSDTDGRHTLRNRRPCNAHRIDIYC